MTTSQPSSSSSTQAFERLHPAIQAWIWDQQWTQLRATQVRAIAPILAADRDVVISAATAGGKTEAAWLPICSALGFENDQGPIAPGVRALYIAPLKALINDQYDRLRSLVSGLEISVARRHGDITGSERSLLAKTPQGIVLITPESLEALFVLQGQRIPTWFSALRFVVIDELHSFIGTERGAQLQSLLHRLELAIRRRVPRVGLSATLADTKIATNFLRPDHAMPADAITGLPGEGAELRMQLRGYEERQSGLPGTIGEGAPSTAQRTIANHLYERLRGSDNLVFANSRSSVETYALLLKSRAEDERVPNEFFPHHGSLAREIREDVEARLKDPSLPTTAVCTSTLEMGIDIGSVDSVAQVGVPPSVAGLRQRLGRSGRRGEPAVFRVYIEEEAIDPRSALPDQLRTRLVQTIAMLDLMLEHWYERPSLENLHFSTLVQQVLSVIAQHGGTSASGLHRVLCGAGPFQHVTPGQFARLLLDLGAADILLQAGDGTLLPAPTGERILNHYSFYAAFHTPLEYRLVAEGRPLGSIPVDFPIVPGQFLIFAARRWRVTSVDSEHRVIDLIPARGGKPPAFGGRSATVDDTVRERMRQILAGTQVPAYLDPAASSLLGEARANYQRYRLDRHRVLIRGNTATLFPWRGDKIMNTLERLLATAGLEVELDGIAITVEKATEPEVRQALAAIVASPPPAATDLAAPVPIKAIDKYDHLLGESLLNQAYAARQFDIPGALKTIRTLLNSPRTT